MVYNWCCVAAVCASVVHLLLLVVDPVSCSSAEQETEAAALFIFGDSLYDAGANNYINTTADFRANFIPYGESFFYKHPTGRFSDGRLLPDFIAEYVKLPLIPPYLLNPDYKFFHRGANFASGGAGALVETHAGLVVDLKTQAVQFNKVEKKLRKEVGDEKAKRVISKAVYMLSIGGNDYLAPDSTLYQSHSLHDYVAMVLGNITTVLKGIHSKGGRKFGFVTIPPLGCLPQTRYTAARNGGCLREANKLAQVHNIALGKTLEKLEMELDGFKYSKFELYDAFLNMINHPSKYGFEEGKKACCGSGPYGGIYSCGGQRGDKEYSLCKHPAEYVFFDSYHPTERAYQQLSELMWTGGQDVIRPYNLKHLFQL